MGCGVYLRLDEDSSKAVEELEWCNDLALNECAGEHCRRRPPSSTEGHLPEPLL
jgi:hypothetical protein